MGGASFKIVDKSRAGIIADEAVEKIIAVLSNQGMRDDLRSHLRRQGEKFSAENFMSGLRDAVERFLHRSGGDVIKGYPRHVGHLS